jgi:hypothetical protein
MKPVPSFPGVFATEDGHVISAWGKQLKPSFGPYGHAGVILYGDFGAKRRTVHSLVAEAFIGSRPDGMDINHKDRNPRNNRPENLEYLTHKENIQHARARGSFHSKKMRMRGGRQCGVTVDEASDICEAFATGIFTMSELTKAYGLRSRNTVPRIIAKSLE